jgi:ABC-type antimicrobial peptide transport system permease subunit
LEGDLPVGDLQLLDDMVARWMTDRRAPTDLLTAFAGVALFLAALGIYGVMSYSVAQRTREVGIRMALGAKGTDLVAWVFAEGLSLTGMGLVAGLGVAFPMSRIMERMLFDVSPADPITLMAASAVLVGAAALATSIPVLRATRVDPNVALRWE